MCRESTEYTYVQIVQIMANRFITLQLQIGWTFDTLVILQNL